MRFSGFRRTGALLLLLAASPVLEATSPAVAVLLPQSGRMAKAADTIRQGLLAAYYQDSRSGVDTPPLHFYNSDNRDIVALVQQAKDNGASLVIGPLDRELLEKLTTVPALPVPVIALNSVEGAAGNLFQFALAPEDEVSRLVDWMGQQGVKRPLLLGAADEASLRYLRIFQGQWLRKYLEPLRVVTLDPARKGGVTAGVRDVVRDIGKHDAFFLATPGVARQVQPALTYYKSTLPLYSLASAWDPTADASGQRDLDGIRFCDLPWMLQDEPAPEQQALYEAMPRPSSGYDRLYAFGADAWTLSRNLQALYTRETLTLRSGTIVSDEARHLRRIPTCAEVRNGNAITLWSPTDVPPGSGSSR